MEYPVSKVFPNLVHYYNDKKRSDVTVVFTDLETEDETKFYLNKMILSIGSDYFAGLFRKHPNAKETKLEGNVEMFEHLIKFLYTGSIPILDGEDNDIYFLLIAPLADFLGISSFFDLFSDRIYDTIGTYMGREDFYDILLFNQDPYYSIFIRDSLEFIDRMAILESLGMSKKNISEKRYKMKIYFIDGLVNNAISHKDDSDIVAITEKRFREIIDLAFRFIKMTDLAIPQNLVEFMNRYTTLTSVKYPILPRPISTRIDLTGSDLAFPVRFGVPISLLDPSTKLNEISNITYFYPRMNDEDVTASLFRKSDIVILRPEAYDKIVPKTKMSPIRSRNPHSSESSSDSSDEE